MSWFYICLWVYFIGAVLSGCIRLVSFYPKDPDRTVFTYAVGWPFIVPTLILRFLIIFGKMLVDDFLKLLRDGF